MDLDVEKFIYEIEKRPAIWNMKSPEYGGRVDKVLQWGEVIDMFTDPSATAEEKRKMGQLLQKRWKTLRDAFVKDEKRLLSAPDNGSTATRYRYHKQLMFLLPVISKHNTVEDDDTSDRQFEENSSEAPEPKRSKKSATVADKQYEDNASTAHPKGSKRSAIEESDVLKIIKSMQQKHDDDSDRQFMLSLVSDFKRVPTRLKSMVKMNILKCITEAQDDTYHDDQRLESQNNYHIEIEDLHGYQPSTSSLDEEQTSPVAVKLEIE